jgi:hypothetical protein
MVKDLVETVSTVTPVEDFMALLARKDKEMFEEGIAEV